MRVSSRARQNVRFPRPPAVAGAVTDVLRAWRRGPGQHKAGSRGGGPAPAAEPAASLSSVSGTSVSGPAGLELTAAPAPVAAAALMRGATGRGPAGGDRPRLFDQETVAEPPAEVISLQVVPLVPPVDVAPAEHQATGAPAAWLPMDPRILQRRMAVQRDVTRRRMVVLSSLLGLVVAAALSVAVVHSSLLQVRHVRVRGAVHTDLSAIVHTAGLDGQPPMIDVHPGAVATRLGRLPWVATVQVSIDWPSTVRIQITERSPVASLPEASAGTPTRWAVVDATGRVLEVTDLPPPGLPHLIGLPAGGPPGSTLVAAAAAPLAVAASLPPDLLARVSALGPAKEAAGEVDLAVAGAGTVRWGTPDDAADKVIAVRTVLARVDLRRVTTIDVRVPQAPTVRRP